MRQWPKLFAFSLIENLGWQMKYRLWSEFVTQAEGQHYQSPPEEGHRTGQGGPIGECGGRLTDNISYQVWRGIQALTKYKGQSPPTGASKLQRSSGRHPHQIVQPFPDSCHCSHLPEGLHHHFHPQKAWYRQSQKWQTYSPHVGSHEVFRADSVSTLLPTEQISPRTMPSISTLTEHWAIWRAWRATSG